MWPKDLPKCAILSISFADVRIDADEMKTTHPRAFALLPPRVPRHAPPSKQSTAVTYRCISYNTFVTPLASTKTFFPTSKPSDPAIACAQTSNTYLPPRMSNLTLSSLSYITREDLAAHLQTPNNAPNIAIIDVRDSDHIGGHIKGSTWVPSNELDYKTPELIRTMRDKDVVVFHCALSQQRGPSAALRYLREKERLDPLGWTEKKAGGEEKGEGEKEGEEGAAQKKQKVVVLRGGFTEWQEKYGPDEKLTEGWQKDVWEFGY
jgi:rhodanese-related sulfurtransferase